MHWPEKTPIEFENFDISGFIDTVKSISCYDFTEYSAKSLKRRLIKIMEDRQTDLAGLIENIKSEPGFLEEVVKQITVNTTELFRDPPVWHAIRHEILPAFCQQDSINIWHAGCSTGQEVYSMMILLNEAGLFNRTSIFASDINQDVMDTARKGLYKYAFNQSYLENFQKVIGEDNPSSKYFTIDKTRDIIKMKSFLTEKPVYRKMDLVKDSKPFNISFDIIICRNVVIYFNYELQNKVFKLFLENLVKGGCLILGAHETILSNEASQFKKKHQAYFKK